jgi:hypothetical protein
MEKLFISIHADVEDFFDIQILKNYGYDTRYSSDSVVGKPTRKSIFCDKTCPITSSEIERVCNISKNLKGTGLKEIRYISCEFITVEEDQPKLPSKLAKLKSPFAVIIYETISIAAMISLTVIGSKPTDWYSAYLGIGGSIAGYFGYQLVTFLKKYHK